MEKVRVWLLEWRVPLIDEVGEKSWRRCRKIFASEPSAEGFKQQIFKAASLISIDITYLNVRISQMEAE